MKIIRTAKTVIIILDLILTGYAVYALYSVSGNKLLTMNSAMGYILAVSYRWALLAAVALLTITVLLFVLSWRINRKKRRKAAIPDEASQKMQMSPDVKSPMTEEPVTEEPVTEEPVTEEPVTEEPVIEEPVTEEPVTEEPVTEEPVTEELVTEELVTDESVPVQKAAPVQDAEPPVAGKPVSAEPVSGEQKQSFNQTALFCGRCGAKRDNGARYCKKCGAKFPDKS